ncbi:MAG: hypothetical protein ACREAC_21745, partial [Blastocatellia bacterium]
MLLPDTAGSVIPVVLHLDRNDGELIMERYFLLLFDGESVSKPIGDALEKNSEKLPEWMLISLQSHLLSGLQRIGAQGPPKLAPLKALAEWPIGELAINKLVGNSTVQWLLQQYANANASSDAIRELTKVLLKLTPLWAHDPDLKSKIEALAFEAVPSRPGSEDRVNDLCPFLRQLVQKGFIDRAEALTRLVASVSALVEGPVRLIVPLALLALDIVPPPIGKLDESSEPSPELRKIMEGLLPFFLILRNGEMASSFALLSQTEEGARQDFREYLRWRVLQNDYNMEEIPNLLKAMFCLDHFGFTPDGSSLQDVEWALRYFLGQHYNPAGIIDQALAGCVVFAEYLKHKNGPALLVASLKGAVAPGQFSSYRQFLKIVIASLLDSVFAREADETSYRGSLDCLDAVFEASDSNVRMQFGELYVTSIRANLATLAARPETLDLVRKAWSYLNQDFKRITVTILGKLDLKWGSLEAFGTSSLDEHLERTWHYLDEAITSKDEV